MAKVLLNLIDLRNHKFGNTFLASLHYYNRIIINTIYVNFYYSNSIATALFDVTLHVIYVYVVFAGIGVCSSLFHKLNNYCYKLGKPNCYPKAPFYLLRLDVSLL